MTDIAEYHGLRDPLLEHLGTDQRRLYFRLKIWERDGGRCGLCGEPVDFTLMDLDHIQQRAAGGPDHWDNLRPTHPRCNRARPSVPIEERIMMASTSVVLNVRLPPAIADQIRALADSADRSVNGQMVRLLRYAIAKRPAPD